MNGGILTAFLYIMFYLAFVAGLDSEFIFGGLYILLRDWTLTCYCNPINSACPTPSVLFNLDLFVTFMLQKAIHYM